MCQLDDFALFIDFYPNKNIWKGKKKYFMKIFELSECLFWCPVTCVFERESHVWYISLSDLSDFRRRCFSCTWFKFSFLNLLFLLFLKTKEENVYPGIIPRYMISSKHSVWQIKLKTLTSSIWSAQFLLVAQFPSRITCNTLMYLNGEHSERSLKCFDDDCLTFLLNDGNLIYIFSCKNYSILKIIFNSMSSRFATVEKNKKTEEFIL